MGGVAISLDEEGESRRQSRTDSGVMAGERICEALPSFVQRMTKGFDGDCK